MSGYSQVGSKTLRQLNRDNAAKHRTHSGATADEAGPALLKLRQEMDECIRVKGYTRTQALMEVAKSNSMTVQQLEQRLVEAK